jgi:lipopolysaccharide/colanic/teichoic acid biosynthesis glycosyltransferase
MIVKRLFDLGVSAVALVMLLPVLAAVGLWVRMDSPGPVLFRQQRVGLHGRPFNILKFRTMVTDAEARGLKVTVGQDPRVTRSGGFLRRTRLDELPQLVNILRGEMSFVGPRPEVPEYVAYYPPEVRDEVLSVRPGLTDFATLAFKDEARMLAGAQDPQRMYVEQILPAKLAYHRRYVSERSLRMDLRLIMKTLRELLS